MRNNQHPPFNLVSIGDEPQSVMIIDQLVKNPGELIDLAAAEPGFSAQASDFYPGVRKPAPRSYTQYLLDTVAPLIASAFQLDSNQRASISLCAFSLTTTPTGKLHPLQCVPHIDTQDRHQFAIVHYLCDERFGGTAFYRHKKTGYESIDAGRSQEYFSQLKAEITSGGLTRLEYVNGSTPLFERIASFDLRFNRALVYRSYCLHSGNISEAIGLSKNPRSGRLTLNSFLNFDPAPH